MKKLLAFALCAAVVMPLFAQEAGSADKEQPSNNERVKYSNDNWPAFFALGEFPACSDLVGLRLTIPFSTKQENVTGLDFGLWGRSQYFEGIQINLLRNDVVDNMSGIQVGVYNSIGNGQMIGIQAGLFNEANILSGLQVGLVNLVGEANGFQVGLINRAETMVGYQVGLINVIRDAELKFFPVLNIGF